MGAWPKKLSASGGDDLTIIIKLYMKKAENIGPSFVPKGLRRAGPVSFYANATIFGKLEYELYIVEWRVAD
jgi:hypothetical protein